MRFRPRRSGLLGLLFDPCPAILQSHRTIEYWPARLRIGIDTEIAETFELISAARRSIRQRRFQLRVGNHFQRVRIQVVGEVLTFFQLIRISFVNSLS